MLTLEASHKKKRKRSGKHLSKKNVSKKTGINYSTYGMIQPGRSYVLGNDSSYKYGFNGKWHDDNIYGKDNSYDYGARFYDPRLGIWKSPDPKAKPNESPYIAFRSNPLLFIDPDGKDNVIFLVELPSASIPLKEQKTSSQEIADQANANFANMGLKTRVIVVDAKGFDISKIDKTDAVAVLGTKSEVTDYVTNDLHNKTFGDQLSNEWEGGGGNPEESANPMVGTGDNIIAIDASGLQGFAGNLELGSDGKANAKVGALALNHGAGHNAGMSHSDARYPNNSSVIMNGGNGLKQLLVDDPSSPLSSYSAVTSNQAGSGISKEGVNQDYVNAIMKRFGNNTASDNRNHVAAIVAGGTPPYESVSAQPQAAPAAPAAANK